MKYQLLICFFLVLVTIQCFSERVVLYRQLKTIAYDSLYTKGKRLYYNGRRISDEEALLRVISRHANSERVILMEDKYTKMQRYMKNEAFFKIFGLCFGAGVQFIGLTQWNGTSEHGFGDNFLFGCLATGCAFQITGVTLGTINKHKRYRKRQEIVDLYNER